MTVGLVAVACVWYLSANIVYTARMGLVHRSVQIYLHLFVLACVVMYCSLLHCMNGGSPRPISRAHLNIMAHLCLCIFVNPRNVQLISTNKEFRVEIPDCE